MAVGAFYQNFAQIGDDEVKGIMKRHGYNVRSTLTRSNFIIQIRGRYASTFLFLSASVISCASLSLWFRNELTEFFKLIYTLCGL